ncbi:MAG: hypothetical protein AAF682_31220 [Planctomycetota bacterium]
MSGEGQSGWDRYWFGEVSLVRLAVFRIVMLAAALYAVWVFRTGVFQHADGLETSFLARSWNPIYVLEALGVPPPGPTAARVVFAVLLGSIALGIVGLFARTACAVAAVLTFYWIGVHYSFGKPHHDCVALMFGLLALPFGPVGGRLSVDSMLRRMRAARSSGAGYLAPPDAGAWAGLPLRLTQISAALGYFFAGATKLVLAGPGWADGYTLQAIMLEYKSAWSGVLADQVALCALMSVGLLFVQVSFPLVFLTPLLRWFYVPMAVVFHLVAMQTMATGPFLTLWFTLVCFIPAERVPAWFDRTLAGGPAWRRIAVGAMLVAFAALTFDLYFAQVPVWLAATLVPAALAVGLRLRGRAPEDVRFDPDQPSARRAVALLDAADWAGRLRFVEAPGAADGLTACGVSGRAAWRRAAARTPFLLPLAFLPLGSG